MGCQDSPQWLCIASCASSCAVSRSRRSCGRLPRACGGLLGLAEVGTSAGLLTSWQNWFIFRHVYTKTKCLQRHSCGGIKMLFLIMSGNGYKLYLQNFSSALLANHLFPRGNLCNFHNLHNNIISPCPQSRSCFESSHKEQTRKL